ncbi:MAG: FAD-binding oxidoreductase [Pseudomonadota bacterium]
MTNARVYKAPQRQSYDVVIIGGAVMGASVAYWLTQNPDFGGTILVVERDGSFEFASTSLASSVIRQQYSNPVNVLMSQFGVEVIRNFKTRMQNFYPAGQAPDLGFKENGMLFTCTFGEVEAAKARVDMQRSIGAHTVFLSPAEIKARFPYINVDDIGGASWGTEAEGWFDNVGLMTGFRVAARGGGADLIENEVVAIGRDRDTVTNVTLATGEVISCGMVVNASGPRANRTAQMAGLEIPVEPRRRDTFIFACAEAFPTNTPQIVDISGAFCRPEGKFFLAGHPAATDGPADYDDFRTDFDLFEQGVWPALAHRVPKFEAIKLQRSWTGHYEFNTLDQNAIIGPHSEVKNFIFINGFSGHGLQQSAAAGRGVSELIVYGSFATLELRDLGYERIAANRPFLEAAVI